MDRRISRRAILAAPLVFTIVSCLGDDEDPTPTSVAGATATEAPARRTVVFPTAISEPTATSTPRASELPVSTPSPTTTSSPSPEATATPTRTEARSPLTGLPVSRPVERPFGIQIDNAVEARPQTGLYRADVVYETPTEAGVTRFTAFYNSDLPYDIGPVRSVRQVALETIPAHDGILVYSGASIDMTQALFESGIPAIHAEGNGISASRRDEERPAPHNLYVAGPRLRDVAESVRFETQSTAESIGFGARPIDGDRTGGVSIVLPAEEVEWLYSMRAGGYVRHVGGEPHFDLREPAEAVVAQNVVIIRASFSLMNYVDDPNGEEVFGVTLTGEGPATLFRDGFRYDARWSRSSIDTPLRLTSAEDDRILRLKPGKTWYTVVPDWLPEATVIPEEDIDGVLP